MASTSENVTENTTVPDWKLAAEGIEMLINNNSDGAQKMFLQYPNSIVIQAGYTFAVFMDALMTFEEDKLSLANEVLKDMEKRCAIKSGWIRSVGRVLGYGQNEPKQSMVEYFETQIIFADSQVLIGTLTFLQQDISGIFKGGWALRKGWKVYQKIYAELKKIYEEHIGPLQLTGPETLANFSEESESELDIHESESSQINGYIPNSHIPHSKSAILHHKHRKLSRDSSDIDDTNSVSNLSFIKKSVSFNSSLSAVDSRDGFWNSPYISLKSSLSYLKALPYFGSNEIKTDMDNETIKRLMMSVSFGYGLLHLGISLLPPTVLRLSHIFGFATDREFGIKLLMYARTGEDMRAPLATLALLWYHTIIRPFYAVDGSNVKAGAEAALLLLQESEEVYSKSSLFLFFKGRMHRTNSDIPAALKCFQEAADGANQREIKLLALHEEGWCDLICLDFCNAKALFLYLKQYSRWSKAFYCYVAVLCTGSCSDIDNKLVDELADFIGSVKVSNKGNQLSEFLLRRQSLAHGNKAVLVTLKTIYWRLLIYEMLYLWNAVSSCSPESIDVIIKDCLDINEDDSTKEPMTGLSFLILGNCYGIKQDFDAAVNAFRKCLDVRRSVPSNCQDTHITAFTQFELASILIKSEETKDEGKAILQQICHLSNYDFEQKLGLRVNSLLKQV